MSKRRYQDVSDFPVMSSCCASCPFGAHGDPAFANSILARLGLWLRQVCHHPRLKGKPETHLCRGAYDAQFAMFRERLR
jgi:hypothetical protein